MGEHAGANPYLKQELDEEESQSRQAKILVQLQRVRTRTLSAPKEFLESLLDEIQEWKKDVEEELQVREVREFQRKILELESQLLKVQLERDSLLKKETS